MKNTLILIAFLLFVFEINAQTNIFPSSGNTGIGTIIPSGKLEIYGANANATNLVLAANYADKFRWRFINIDRGIAIDLDVTASDVNDVQETIMKLTRSNSGRPEFQLHNNTIVANDGNVGIGNATPSEKLHASGNILSDKLLLNDPNTTSDWNMNWQSGFFQSYDATNAPEANQWFWGINMNHDANNLSYRYNGQIAIRNSSTSPAMYFRSTDVNGSGTWARIVNSVGNQYISGKLGLGTTTYGNHKLAVEGSIGAREIKVEASGWSDFVFEKKYVLPSLNEVEQHINEKGHLKDIPSAAEVIENGFFLGEMDAKLLQEIEELTLYAIEQNKKIEGLSLYVIQLGEENKEMKKELNLIRKENE